MATLQELRDAYAVAGAALRDAQDRLGRARDRARSAVFAVAELERDAIDGDEDAAALTAARSERADAMNDLRTLEEELRPT